MDGLQKLLENIEMTENQNISHHDLEGLLV